MGTQGIRAGACRWAYADRGWAHIAALAPLLVQCAQQGDEVAQAQVAAAVGDLVTSVMTVAGKLQIQQAFSVVLAGGAKQHAAVA